MATLCKLSMTTGKRNWRWGKPEQKAFDEAKEILKKAVVLAYPDFEKPFDLYTDASDLQLGATLVQGNKPIGFYTRKLNSAQMDYTVGEKELLGIVEGFKEFEGILRGTETTVHTNHLNLLYRNLPSQIMVQWRLLLKEYHPFFKHVTGVVNDVADALSRLEMIFKASDELIWETANPRKRNRKNNKLCKNMVTMSYTSSAIDKVSD